MPYAKKSYRSRYSRGKKSYAYRKNNRRKKWKQQKLAVGTVQKIARQIAKSEDKKQLVKYCHVQYIKATGANWFNKREIPSLSTWKTVSGTGQDSQINFQVVSDLGGNVEVANLLQQDNAQRAEVEIRINGIECFGILRNNATAPMRFEIRLIYIPNNNTYTNSSIDYIQPRISMFFKDGHGSGNLLRQGYNRREMGATDGTGIPITFQTLARKVIFMPASSAAGSIVGLKDNSGSLYNAGVVMDTPALYKRFKLAKYFKNPRKAFCRGTSPLLSDGQYFLVYWSDHTGTNSFNILATSNLQYTLKAPMNQDDP